jgi:YHS domain-containing protein
MATVKDPICGKDVDTLRARAVGIYGGVTYYFCSKECKEKYVDPRKAPREAASTPAVAKPAPAPKLVAKAPPARKDPTPAPKKDPTPAPKKDPTPAKKEREDSSLDMLPLKMEAAGGDDDEPLPDLTPDKPHRTPSSPSVIAEIGEMKKESRRWAVIIVILAALVVAAAVLSLRN